MVMRHFGGGIGHQSKLKPTGSVAQPSNDIEEDDGVEHDAFNGPELNVEEIENRLEELDQRGDDEELDDGELGEALEAGIDEEDSEKEDLIGPEVEDDDDGEDGEDGLYED